MSMSPDEVMLAAKSFLRDYRNSHHQAQLVGLAVSAYNVACYQLRNAPNIYQCYSMYWVMLEKYPLFLQLARRKYHLYPRHYQAYAQALARIVLTNHWNTISSTRCP